VEDPPASDPKPAEPAVESGLQSGLESRLAPLRDFHAEVDADADRLAIRNRERLQCRLGCASCCVDELTVFEIEAERIRRAHPTLLRDGEPHPSGACAFLSAGRECRVYADRPYVCRTQGLPLRWLEEDEAGEVRERRDICPLNEAGPPLATLAESDCWWIGPTELELLRIQEDSGAGERIALRALFKR
jgi:Fe-S-cluster containining protein